MKKIVSIVAAAAMAASMFAVDASAAIKFNGSLLDMSKDSDVKVLRLDEPKAQKGHGQTGIDLNVSTDQAGATLIIGNGYGGNNDISYQGYKLWVKPADALKINFGALDYCLNKESIDWAGSLNATGDNGVALDISAGGFSANLIFNPGYGKNWYDGKVIGNTAVMAKYGAGFGTIGFAWIGEPTATVEAKEYFEFDSTTGNSVKKTVTAVEGKSFTTNTLSLGYSNNFGGVSMFADAAMVLKEKLSNIKADLFVNGNADSFGYAAYVDFDYDAASSKIGGLGIKAKLTYNLGACTPYLYVKDANVMADTFAMTLKPGVNFNVGAAGVEIAANVDLNGSSYTLSVPFAVNLNF